MKASSRPTPSWRPRRHHAEAGRRPRRSPHRMPSRQAGGDLRLLEPPPPSPPPPPPPVADVRPRPARWKVAVLVVLLAVLLAEGVFLVRVVRGEKEPAAGPARVDPLRAPPNLPRQGTLVVVEIGADGAVDVAQWISDLDGIAEIVVSPPRAPVEIERGRVVTAEGRVLSEDVDVADGAQRIEVPGRTTVVRVTYRLRGAVERSSTVPGRGLARSLFLPVDHPGEQGLTVVTVAGGPPGVQVRALSCVDARSPVALLRPCGAPDGPDWRVRLDGDERDDAVAAQVDLR